MSNLKFRAWIKEAGCWSGAFSIHKTGLVSDLIDAEIDEGSGLAISDAHWNENDLIVEQYTGLNDKNGVEIYEGDIILCGTPHTEKPVTFENGRFGTRTDGGFYTLNGWITGGRSVEVVGNIH